MSNYVASSQYLLNIRKGADIFPSQVLENPPAQCTVSHIVVITPTKYMAYRISEPCSQEDAVKTLWKTFDAQRSTFQ